jgi:serine/threonine protein kinase/Tfp pilus assembly protein PilF
MSFNNQSPESATPGENELERLMQKSQQAGRPEINPELTQDQRNQLEALAEEYAQRKRDGEHVALQAYVDRFPELASDIRELFPVVALLDQAGGKSIRPDVRESNEPIEPGTRLGEYHLIRVIGRGGMGVVYQAEHIALGSIAAIKVLPASRSGAKGRERFHREASAAARMHHPNIVRVFDFGCHGDSLYYVMPLVKGWGLDRLIGNHEATSDSKTGNNEGNDSIPPTKYDLAIKLARSDLLVDDSQGDLKKAEDEETGPVAADRTHRSSSSGSCPDDLWSWIAGLGIQAADALDYAHTAGIVHRDVKPSNLMIDADNHVYITDFGLAKIVDEHTLTGTGDLLGTLRYMPPEAFSGRADHRSDIYGLGLTLYELLADRPALLERERGPLMTAITEGKIARLQTLVPGIPRDLQTVIHKAIDIDPAARYQTANEFLGDLQRFVVGQPIQARRSTWAYRTSRWISRNRAVAALTSLTILSLAAGLVFSSIGWSKAIQAELTSARLATLEKRAREFAESETAAKERALIQKDAALVAKQLVLEQKELQRKTAKAISDYLLNDLLPMTTVDGQSQSGSSDSLNKDSTLQDVLDRSAKKLKSRKSLDTIVEAELSRVIGISYRHIGKHQLSVPLLERAVELLESELAPDDPKLLKTMNSLAVGYSMAGQKRNAEKIYRRILLVNPEKTYPLYTLNYAALLESMGKLEQATALAEEALLQSQNEPDNEGTVAQAMYVLGDLLMAKNDLERAIPLLEESVRLYQVNWHDSENSLAVRSMRALCDALHLAGKHAEAIDLAEKVYEITKRTRHENEPEYGYVLNQLANAYRKSGDHIMDCNPIRIPS